MKKLLVFVGESGSGKTTIITELARLFPSKFKKVVTCTSRSMRAGEIDGEDYHFLPTEYFINNQDLVLTKKTDEGFYYGTKKVDLFSRDHHLLLASKMTGIGKLLDLGLKNILAVCISISHELKIARMRQRGDTEEMILSRLQSETKSMVNVDLSQIQVIKLDATQLIDTKIQCILLSAH